MRLRAWLLAAAFAMAVVLPAGASASPGQVEVVDDPPFTRIEGADVAERARLEPELRTALQLRPAATLRVRYLPQRRVWRVSARDANTARTLASIELDDRTGRVVGRFALPVAEYPPRLTAQQATDAATSDPRVRREARRWGGTDAMRSAARFEDGIWEVDFFDPDRRGERRRESVLRADVLDTTRSVQGVWTGFRIAWKMARGERGAFGGDMNERFVWLPLAVIFLLLVVDWTRLRALRNADAAALLGLGISHELFLEGRIEWSVPLAVPPLLWLAGSMGWRFLRGVDGARAPSAPARRPSRVRRFVLRRVPTMLLVVLCVAIAGVRIGVTLDGGNVIDVGYAGVAGARLELEGKGPWGAMPADIQRGDTYGPANYLAYVPAVALLDDPGQHRWGGPFPAAQATSIAADLGCALLLALVGWRWLSRRAAVLLAACWLACPWTSWALASGVNDALVALPLLGAFALVRVPLARGALVGVAAMVKFAPLAVLAPFLHVGARGRFRQSLLTGTGAGLVVLAGLAWVAWRLDGGVAADLRLLWERTLAFQSERDSPFSPWGLYGWHDAQRVAQVVVALLVAAAAFLPRARDAWQVAAGGACVLVLAQLVVTHWTYLYVPWFVGFVLVVLVAERERDVVRRYAPAP